jgi:hypothetical protein
MKAITFAGGSKQIAATRSTGKISWGYAELFIISQTVLPALLLLPGTQAIRLPIRGASFGVSFATLLWWVISSARAARPHQAQPWLIASMAYTALMIVHPGTYSTLAGVAQFVLCLSVVAPFFWASAFVRSPDQLARLMGLLLLCNGLNALVGVLQVYDPAHWMPAELSRIMTDSRYGLGTVTYGGPNGQAIVRPPGLFDYPGAVAGPGMYAALLGVVFATSAIGWWRRLASLLAAAAGIAAIYLSQVRVSLVLSILMFLAYASILVLQNRKARATMVAAGAATLVVTTFSFALVLGGRSIAERTMTLLAEDPVTLYSGSRGGQLRYAFGELLQKYPLGAGLGNWGMVPTYFGGTKSQRENNPLWVEIQVAGWAVDGGVVLLGLSVWALVLTLTSEARTARSDPDAKVRACAAVILAANLGTAALIFTFTPFVTQVGLQFWFLAGALHGVVGARSQGRA